MTNEEAISIITQIKGIITNDNSWSDVAKVAVKEAFDLAIQALETGEIYITGEDYNLYMEGYKAGKKDFEPKQGEWIYRENLKKHQCNKCGMFMPISKEDIEEGYELPNFCSNCGADMRKGGVKNGENDTN